VVNTVLDEVVGSINAHTWSTESNHKHVANRLGDQASSPYYSQWEKVNTR